MPRVNDVPYATPVASDFVTGYRPGAKCVRFTVDELGTALSPVLAKVQVTCNPDSQTADKSSPVNVTSVVWDSNVTLDLGIGDQIVLSKYSVTFTNELDSANYTVVLECSTESLSTLAFAGLTNETKTSQGFQFWIASPFAYYDGLHDDVRVRAVVLDY